MKIDFTSSETVRAAIPHVSRVLVESGVILLPTETFYGLAAAVDDRAAVERIHSMKGRPSDLALPVLCATWAQVNSMVVVPEDYRHLLVELWPGALTVVVPARYGPLAASEDGSLAVRIPDHQELRALLSEVGPVTGTSANRHGAAPCRTVSEALESLLESPDLVLDGGPTFGGKSSTMVDLRVRPPKVIRTGPVVWPLGC
ncbi:MAG: threonylcarbamoyl-AMP synthase [bacterium]|nr:threonylcarbamoyl-AMP synthase [bacterium]